MTFHNSHLGHSKQAYMDALHNYLQLVTLPGWILLAYKGMQLTEQELKSVYNNEV